MDKIELSTFESGRIQYEAGSKQEKVFKFVTCGDLSGFDTPEAKVGK